MDLNNIAQLLPEFLGILKEKDSKNLPEIISAVGNSGMLEKVLGSGSKYTKYLPLLPLLSKLNAEGFKGLLNNSESIAPLISTFMADQGKGGSGGLGKIAGIDIANLAPLLPLITGFLNKDKKQEGSPAPAAQAAETSTKEAPPAQNTAAISNPLAPVSGIADKDIIYYLNKYISNN